MNSYRVKPTDAKPWYQYPYVWLLIFFPLTAVVAGIYTMMLAIESDDGLVVDDYYKKGLEINRVLERDQKAVDLGLKTDVSIDNSAGLLNINLHTETGYPYPQQLRCQLLHATRDGFDQSVDLQLTANNHYQSLIERLAPGRWYVQIESENWRIVETIFIE